MSYPGGSLTTTVGSVVVSNGATITPSNPLIYTSPRLSTTMSMSMSEGVGVPSEYISSVEPSSTLGAVPAPSSDGEIPTVSTPPSISSPMIGESTSSTADPTQPTSFPGSSVSPNGLCGANTGFFCPGSGFGDCCSLFDFCGSTEEFCDATQGCQPEFGTCNEPPTSSKGTDQATIPDMEMSTTMPGMPGMTTSTAQATPTAVSSFTCPADEGAVVDAAGVSYQLGCGGETSTNGYVVSRAVNSFNDCLNFCSTDLVCSGFTYQGAANGAGEGFCYLKSGDNVEIFPSEDANRVAGVRTGPADPSASLISDLPVFTTPGETTGPVDLTDGVSATSTQGPIGVPTSTVNPTCPAADRSTVNLSNGEDYRILCLTGSSPSSYSSVEALTFAGCIDACAVSPNCVAMTYVGTRCYLKDSITEYNRSGSANMAVLESYFEAIDVSPPEEGGLPISSALSSILDVPTTTPTAPGTPSESPTTQPVGDGISPSGRCGTSGNGGSPEGFTCMGSVFGDCCSFSGFCGRDSDYCGPGCQYEFGECSGGIGIGIIISIGGRCNAENGNQTCTGSLFGDCCSTSGYCGRSSDYCAPANCDPTYGECDEEEGDVAPTSQSFTILPTSLPIANPTSQPAASQSSVPPQITAPGEQDTFNCPQNDGQVVIGSNGERYIVNCQADIASGSYASRTVSTSWNECFQLCNDVPSLSGAGSCTSFTYVGANFGRGGGECYLKNTETETFDPRLGTLGSISAIKIANYGGSLPIFPAPGASVTASAIPPAVSLPISESITDSPTQPTDDTPTQPTPDAKPTISLESSSSPSVPANDSSGPYILTSPIRCDFGGPPTNREDDSWCEIALPFSVQLYTTSDGTLYPSTNSFISLLIGSQQYQAAELPTPDIPANSFVPFFDDLAINADVDPLQGVFYSIGETGVTVECYVSRASDPNVIFQFNVEYDTAVPGVAVYSYYRVGASTDNGLFASVGIQGDEF